MQKHSLRANEWPTIAAQRYLDMVYRLAYAKTANRQDAEDITQNVMLKLVKHSHEIATETHLRHWLIRVTVNESVSLFRSAWRRLTLPMDAARIAECSCDTQNDELDAALSLLSDKLRVVIHLFYYEEMTTSEIAEALGIKPETVRERLHRARKKLKLQLTQRGGDVFV